MQFCFGNKLRDYKNVVLGEKSCLIDDHDSKIVKRVNFIFDVTLPARHVSELLCYKGSEKKSEE